MENGALRKPSFGLAVAVLLLDAFIICVGVLSLEISDDLTFGFGQGAQIPLLMAAIVTGISGIVFLKIPWDTIEQGIFKAISVAIQAMLILMIIGALVGAWVQSGVAPTLIYYGLNLLSPKYFLLAALFICSIVSLSTGSSWSTSGTVGIALMGIGAGLNIPAPMTAGFIISGAYFGDKMSPLSETTNLAPAVSGADLFDHIRAMCWTTLPAIVLVAVIAYFMGANVAGEIDASKINLIQHTMGSEFTISPFCLIPPLLILVLAAMKMPAIPGVVIGMLGGVVISLFNGIDIGNILNVLWEGYTPGLISKMSSAENMDALVNIFQGTALEGSTYSLEMFKEVGALLEQLFARGGVNGMMGTIALILMALSLGGTLEACGYLQVMLDKLLAAVKSAFGLVASVIVSCVFSNAFLADQYLSLVIPGRMFKGAFEDTEFNGKKLDKVMLSRSLEDSGTLTSVLIPWNTCGAYNAGVLGVSTFAYAPYAFLNYLVPIIALVMTKFGIGVKWVEKGSKVAD